MIFWAPEVKIDERAVYQIVLTAPPNIYISSLPFASLAVYLREDSPPILIRHVQGELPAGNVQQVRLGHVDYSALPAASVELEANLRWRPGGSLVLTGSLSSASPLTISVSFMNVVAVRSYSDWDRLPKLS